MVICLNSLAYDEENPFAMNEEVEDPDGQFNFLFNQLLYVEQNEGLAIILSHIPPNKGSSRWAMRYTALFERF